MKVAQLSNPSLCITLEERRPSYSTAKKNLFHTLESCSSFMLLGKSLHKECQNCRKFQAASNWEWLGWQDDGGRVPIVSCVVFLTLDVMEIKIGALVFYAIHDARPSCTMHHRFLSKFVSKFPCMCCEAVKAKWWRGGWITLWRASGLCTDT